MAKCEVRLPEAFLLKCSRLAENTDKIIEKSLQAGGEVVLKKVRGNLQAVIGKDTKYKSEATGELLDSLGMTPAKVSNKGIHNVKIGFSATRSSTNATLREKTSWA